MNQNQRMELAQWTTDRALKSGADQVAVSISNQREIDIEFREQKLETLKESTQNSLSLEIYTENRYSGHSTNDLRKDNLLKFIDDAVASTKYLTQDLFRALPDPEYYPKEPSADLNICDPSYRELSSNGRIKLASEIEAIAMAQSTQIISTTAGYSDLYYETVRIHSNGLQVESKGTRFSAGAEVTAKDKAGGRPEDWFYASVRNHCDLPSSELLGKTAAQRAIRKIGQYKIKSGKYDMLVENRASSRLTSMLFGPMSARALQQKSSFLEGMLGKKIASEKLTIIDDPGIEKGLGSRFWDGEGLVAKRKVMIEKGILTEYYIDNYYGKKLGMKPTSASPSNIVFEYGSRPLEEMIKTIKKGILVNGFLGGNSNPTTGDFSLGIVGLLVENGEIVHPVNEMNISGNARKFWESLIEMGNDPYPYSQVRIPAMLFEGVQFSGL